MPRVSPLRRWRGDEAVKTHNTLKKMKKLQVLTEAVKGGRATVSNKGRAKLIIWDNEVRPEYIEVDTFSGQGDEYKQRKNPIIRIHFADNQEWHGTIEDLKEKII